MEHHGFVDIQQNGYIGVHFSSMELTLEKVRKVTRYLAKSGTTAYCPTVVTGPMEMFRRNLPILAAAMHDKELKPHLLGIHMEGPFISPVEGARGAHPPQHIIKPDVDTFKRFQEWAEGQIVILTVAPEVKGALPLIRYAAENGTVVAFGHHLAEDRVMESGLQAGARLCTHLGNGLPNLINRHQNPIWWQLACDKLMGTFVTDGQHLPADFIKVALRAKTVKRFIVVSDATELGGLKPGEYRFQGHAVILEPSGRIGFKGTPYLAGSSATMLQCMNYLASLNLLSEADLWKVGYDNPLRLLGRRLSRQPCNTPTVVFKNNQFALA
ncbi:MAG: N-acetylglucosamine-6-phosphate deacetylase [Kiritimatiellae bacterium]|nr:N-acetylglucosamine-6-phosphate deacetylase [Kiritimatiellia bacterium]